MTGDRDTLVRYRLLCASEALADAEANVSDERWRAAVNRLYYAAFYAVSALLLSHDLQSRKHTGVRGLFMRHYGTTGQFEPELVKTFNRLFDSRLKSDYTDLYEVEPDFIRNAVAPTRALIARVAALIEEKQ